MKELRYMPIEFRAENESRLVEGYAVLFGVESISIGNAFTEIIEPGSLDGVLEISDVLVPLNHNESRGLLARCTNLTGSCKLTIDERGLNYSFEAPNTSLGDELIVGLKRKDIRNSSFAFTVAENGERWEKKSDGTYLRRILKFAEIHDVSPVYKPIYSEASVALRSLESFRKKETETNPELEYYYQELKKQFEFLK